MHNIFQKTTTVTNGILAHAAEISSIAIHWVNRLYDKRGKKFYVFIRNLCHSHHRIAYILP